MAFFEASYFGVREVKQGSKYYNGAVKDGSD
jgi:hypothetical protein